jgi:hypothetical protein
MSDLAVVTLAFLLGVFLMMLLAIGAMNLVTPRMIGDKHHALQDIVESRQVPVSWRKPFASKTAAAPAERVAAIRQQAKQHYLRELDGLIAYASRSTLVADEETRQMLLDQLADVRAEWHARPAQDM